MNVINATTHANTQLVWELESCRANKAGTAAVKRRIRRQMRQRLAAELRGEMHQIHVDAAALSAELTVARRSVDRMVNNITKELNRQIEPTKKADRQIVVTRKLAGDSFKRKHIEIAVLVA